MDMKILGMRKEIWPAMRHRFSCVQFLKFFNQGKKKVVVVVFVSSL
jgi:hypothetical protein